jgi:hypothetical protein
MPASSSQSNLSHYVSDRIRPHVDKKEIAGAVVLVAKDGRILAFDTIGCADLKTKRPMKKSDVFCVSSMTKPIIATAIPMLSDEGKVSVDDMVAKHLPYRSSGPAWLYATPAASAACAMPQCASFRNRARKTNWRSCATRSFPPVSVISSDLYWRPPPTVLGHGDARHG